MVKMVAVPVNSQISQHLENAHFYDAFQLNLAPCKRTALEIYLEVIAKTPSWISFLMALRNRAAPMFGLKDLGPLGNVQSCKPSTSYRVGDRVGIFTIHSMTDDEVILTDSDKHLEAKISVCKSLHGTANAVTVSTVVHVHNLLGHVYLFFVVPFHKRIVPSMLLQSESRTLH
ncbi:DUF2867 domain-containing protein [Solimicrobium silvestre]|uniref:DUF2867 domain-containing protein n=1 Tax=Solimicrobium silvestre TaxID=2099400 RepID=A0A2S9GWF8_9BURK|nr:DUF2867 domain-containing protein [Solimicrobium silvestre]PRC92059.1 hypothetical protein S2091_3194 [Solimicrobium silvestre]